MSVVSAITAAPHRYIALLRLHIEAYSLAREADRVKDIGGPEDVSLIELNLKRAKESLDEMVSDLLIHLSRRSKNPSDPVDRGSSYAKRLMEGKDHVALAAMGIGYGPTYPLDQVLRLLQRAWADGYRAGEEDFK